MQMIRGAAALTAGVLMVGGLAACGDEGEPEESSSTASPSEVERTSSSEPSSSSGSGSSSSSSGSSETQGEGKVAELPKAAKKRTKEGAIAFNKFYQEQLGEALTSGNTATLKEYTHECVTCDDFIKATEKDKAKGVTMDRAPYSAHKLQATTRDDGGMRVSLLVKSTGYREVLKDGSAGRSADPTSFTLVTDTQWHDGHWVIHDTVITE